MPRRLATSSLLFCSLLLIAADAPTYSAQIAKVDFPADLKDAFRAMLDEQAIQFGDGKETIGTFWFRKEVPAKATIEQVKNGLTYREIPLTTVIGVVKFEKSWIDFRNQEIVAGVYTMRLALQPQDGDHMGTAPHPDFCLLVPIANDGKPDLLDFEKLKEMSGAATGGTHPGVVLLFPNHKPQDEPKVVSKGKGIWVLNRKQAITAADQKTALGFGIVIAGNAFE